tara:strand:+ start:2040 stop:2237 length:198 start_codon:yes stop_codon:yes gene_type:complete
MSSEIYYWSGPDELADYKNIKNHLKGTDKNPEIQQAEELKVDFNNLKGWVILSQEELKRLEKIKP